MLYYPLWVNACANTRACELRSFLTNGINRAGRRSPESGADSERLSSASLGRATCGTTYPAVGEARALMGAHMHNGSGIAHLVLRARRLTNQTSLFALNTTPIAAVIILYKLTAALPSYRRAYLSMGLNLLKLRILPP